MRPIWDPRLRRLIIAALPVCYIDVGEVCRGTRLYVSLCGWGSVQKVFLTNSVSGVRRPIEQRGVLTGRISAKRGHTTNCLQFYFPKHERCDVK